MDQSKYEKVLLGGMTSFAENLFDLASDQEGDDDSVYQNVKYYLQNLDPQILGMVVRDVLEQHRNGLPLRTNYEINDGYFCIRN